MFVRFGLADSIFHLQASLLVRYVTHSFTFTVDKESVRKPIKSKIFVIFCESTFGRNCPSSRYLGWAIALNVCTPGVEEQWNSSGLSYKSCGILQGLGQKSWNSLGVKQFLRNSSEVNKDFIEFLEKKVPFQEFLQG